MIKTPLSAVIGGAFWTPSATILGSTSKIFNQLIKSLFANGEQGFAYDPNDLSTMFQDAAGTVPVTGAGQAVGLMLDKSKGLTLSSELVLNGDFSSGATSWTTSETVTISGGVVNFNNAESGALVLQANPTNFIVGRLYKVTYTIISISGGSVSCAMGSNLGTIRATAGTYTEYIVAQSANVYIRARINGTTATIDNIRVNGLAGNHAYQTNAASRPLLQRNATTGAYYLAFDGSDDFLVTSSINFTATDKVSLFTGVRKLSDAVTAIICELSANLNNNTGSFYFSAPPSSGSPKFGVVVKGVTAGNVESGILAAPASAVTSIPINLSANSLQLKVNGITTSNGASLGGGNFGNYPLYIGRRGGTSIPFNGHLYSLVGVGRLATESETTAIEKELAKRVGVTLNV